MSLPRLTTKSEIRRRLERDRHWSLYALADLDDGMFEHCGWWAREDDDLLLVFNALAIRPIFVMGDVSQTRALLEELDEPLGYLNLQEHQLDCAAGLYTYRERRQMRRMFVEGAFAPRSGAAEPLGIEHQREIEALYASGDGGGMAFAPFQLATGMFRGVRCGVGGELVAVAGVHVLSPNESVAGVGNIFTHPDHRGRGHAQVAASAVVTALRDAGIATIGLNVDHTNAAAIRAYERIGFKTRFQYYEGVAERR